MPLPCFCVQYYNSKQHKEDDPAQAIEGFEKVRRKPQVPAPLNGLLPDAAAVCCLLNAPRCLPKACRVGVFGPVCAGRGKQHVKQMFDSFWRRVFCLHVLPG